MHKEDKIHHLTIDDLPRYLEIDYVDGDIAFTDNIGYHSVKPAPFRIDAVRLLSCMKGSLKVEINTKEYTIHANEVLCCGPNVMLYNVVPSPDLECRILALSTRLIRRIINAGSGVRNKIFHVNQNPVIRIGEEGARVFMQYHELLISRMKAEDNSYRKDIMASLAGAVFYELLANLDTYCLPAEETTLRQGDVLFKRFIQLLSRTEVKVRSVPYYADKLFVTPKYLSSVCKRVSGKTAFELINDLVMEDITELFRYTDKSIKEIAEYLDFSDLSFFGKYVKSHTGFSPTEYRRRLSRK